MDKEYFLWALYSFFLIVLGFGIGILASYAMLPFQIPDCNCAPLPPCICNSDYECPDCILYEDDPELPQFNKIIDDLASEHEYNRENYNCDDYSKELTSRLNDAGYESYYCVGQVSFADSDDELHAWVKACTFIESVTGEILTPAKFKANYYNYYCKK